jgi:hypothetical protein
MRRAFYDICNNGLPYLYEDHAKDTDADHFLDGWTRRLLMVVCAGAVKTLGLERTLELLDAERARLTGANVVNLN